MTNGKVAGRINGNRNAGWRSGGTPTELQMRRSLRDGFVRICLEKTGCRKKTSLRFGNQIGRYFQSAKHPIVCDKGPCDMSHPLNAQSFSNATKSEVQGRRFDRADKVATMRGNGNAGTRVPNHWKGWVLALVGIRRGDKSSEQGLCGVLKMVWEICSSQKGSNQGWRMKRFQVGQRDTRDFCCGGSRWWWNRSETTTTR